MKITLFALNSSYTHTNLAVRYLAHVLEDQAKSITLLEFNLKDKHDNILKQLYLQHSDIYAFSVYIWNRKEMLTFARELKSLSPDCKIIFGGPEVSFEDKSFFDRHPYIDSIISGEGEKVIIELTDNIEKYHHMILFGESDKEGFCNCPILYDKYPSEGDILYYESSRGCPHRCSYCLSSLTKGIYSKSTKKTLEDLKAFEALPKKPRIIKFIDRTFNYDLKRAKEIWKALCNEEYSLNYHFEICADTLDKECFDILSKMPKGKIQFEAGIQSTNHKTLEGVNRKTDNKRAIENLSRLKAMGNIHIHADLIAGLVYEDIDSFKRSFDETIDCCHKLQLGFLKMLRGSKVRSESDSHGYIYSPDPPYTVLENRYISFEEMCLLKQMAEVIDRVYSSGRFGFTCEYILKKATSPFEFFSELTQRIGRDVERISQNELRLILFAILKEGFDDEALSRLALDTLIWENKNPPKELSPYFNDTAREKNINVYTFPFDPGRKYLIDRTKHTFDIIT